MKCPITRLDRLAEAMGVNRQRAYRLFRAGVIPGKNFGRGKGLGIFFRSADEARRAAAAIFLSLILPSCKVKDAIPRVLDEGHVYLPIGFGPAGVRILSYGAADVENEPRAEIDVRQMRLDIDVIVNLMSGAE